VLGCNVFCFLPERNKSKGYLLLNNERKAQAGKRLLARFKISPSAQEKHELFVAELLPSALPVNDNENSRKI